MAARTAAGCEPGDAVAACWLTPSVMIPHVIALVSRCGAAPDVGHALLRGRLASEVPRRPVPTRTRTEAAMRCSYVYFMKDDPDRVAAVAAEHAAYWRG